MKKIIILTKILFTFFLVNNTNAQTPGTLTFSYTPVSHTGYSGTKNVLAVWIQTSTGVFVKSKLRYASLGSTEDHLPAYGVNCGATASDCITNGNTTDATTGATLANFTAKSITWDGKNVVGTTNGSVVADGTYKVTIQSTWNHGTAGTTTRSFSFTKGTVVDHQTPASDANFTNIIADWTPGPLANESFFGKPNAVIYPNPTNGIFNIDLKNEVKSIKVINILGEIVYEEKVVNESIEKTKSINLSNFQNGIYIINFSNDLGNSNYKVILNK